MGHKPRQLTEIFLVAVGEFKKKGRRRTRRRLCAGRARGGISRLWGAFKWLRKLCLKNSTEATMDLIESMEASTIRVDNTTKKGSAIDTVRLVLGGDSSAANTSLKRLIQANAGLGARCSRLKKFYLSHRPVRKNSGLSVKI